MADRDLVRWYWPHVYALHATLEDLNGATLVAAPAANIFARQMELARRLRAMTWTGK